MVINSNHTFARNFLYQPGFNGKDEARACPPGPKKVPYEAQMIALADAMAEAAGYVSMYSYELYDVTGATEDWNYFARAPSATRPRSPATTSTRTTRTASSTSTWARWTGRATQGAGPSQGGCAKRCCSRARPPRNRPTTR